MNEEKNVFENSPTEQIENPATTETQVMPTTDLTVTPIIEEQPQEEQKSKKGAIIAITAIAVAVAAGIGIAAATGALSPAPGNVSASAPASTNATVDMNADAGRTANTDPAPGNVAAGEASKPEGAEASTPTASGGGGSQASQGGPSQQATGGGSPAQKQKVWVVDVPAHTETIHHDAEGYWQSGGYATICTACGATLNDQSSLEAHRSQSHPNGGMGWTDVSIPAKFIETKPAWDETVSVSEQGHWEYR